MPDIQLSPKTPSRRIRQHELIEAMQRYTEPNEALINGAYIYALGMFGSQRRASGEPAFFHSLEAAWTLISLEADSQTIAGALLHDTIEDTEATHKEIEDRFGSDVGTMVIGLTHSFQKLARAMANDYRVMLIKLADRHHNMLTLGFRRPSPARTAVAKETLDFYAPLAGQMGLEHIEYELRELAHMELGSSSTGPKQPNEQKLRTKLARILSEDETQAFFHQLTLYKPSRNLKAQITGYMQPSADVS